MQNNSKTVTFIFQEFHLHTTLFISYVPKGQIPK